MPEIKAELKDPDDLRKALEVYVAAGGPNAAYARLRLLALDLIADMSTMKPEEKPAMMQAIAMGLASGASELIGFVVDDCQPDWSGFLMSSLYHSLQTNPNIRKDIIPASIAAMQRNEARVEAIMAMHTGKPH